MAEKYSDRKLVTIYNSRELFVCCLNNQEKLGCFKKNHSLKKYCLKKLNQFWNLNSAQNHIQQ